MCAAQLCFATSVGASVEVGCRLFNATTSDRVAPAISMAWRSTPNAMPPWGGAPNWRLEQEAKLLLRLVGRNAEQIKHGGRLHPAVVNAPSRRRS
jgi:hypothetical protein